jgi:hypothetical protein
LALKDDFLESVTCDEWQARISLWGRSSLKSIQDVIAREKQRPGGLSMALAGRHGRIASSRIYR